jgi:ribokinase
VPEPALAAVDVLVVNAIEVAMLAEQAGLGAAEPAELARVLAGRFGGTCVVTLGRDGAIAVAPDGAWQVTAMPVEPIDTTGAGDAFVGALLAALDGGATLPQALRRASVGAGLACLTVGCQSSFATAAAIEARLGEVAEPMPL